MATPTTTPTTTPDDTSGPAEGDTHGRGATTADSAVHGDRVQEVEAAMPDLLCWMYAAVPLNERTGGLNARRFAQIFDVAPATVYRWIREAHGREFFLDARRQLWTLAMLRGRGEILCRPSTRPPRPGTPPT